MMEERPFRKRPARPVDPAEPGWPSRFAWASVKTAAWMVPPLIVLRFLDSGWRWPAAAAAFCAGIIANIYVEVIYQRRQMRRGA
jgi:hypothetical protein